VKDSRPTEDNSAIRRRRSCAGCGARFTTFERVQLREMIVIKAGNDGRKEVFDREKLIRSLRVCLKKRPVDSEQIEKTANSIVRQLETMGESEVSSMKIGELVMNALVSMDAVGYIRYASVYKDFCKPDDYNAFLEELNEINDRAGIAAE
jgi:transcriptional repressor NrdR